MSTILGPGIIGFVGKESGVIIVLSTDEQRVLFASRDAAPLRWVLVEDFTVDPAVLVSGDYVKRKLKE